MITIIDYGMGNLASVKNAFTKVGFESVITNKAEDIINATKVVLPGVGAFEDAIKNIRNLGLEEAIKHVVSKGTPVLGVCLGLQLLFSESEENGINKGLDIIKGKVIKLPPNKKIPHMGWNSIKIKENSRLFKGIPQNSYFYFIHSYYVLPTDDSYIVATSNYEIDFTCAIEKNNLFATQFHPEKSSDLGLQVLKNFGEI